MSKHSEVTGCGLVQSDFFENDPPCADGGWWHEHDVEIPGSVTVIVAGGRA